GGLQILLHPDRVVEGHRLTPVGHGKAGIRGLGSAKGVGSGRIFKVVKQRQASKKVGLGRSRARVCEVDVTVPAVRRRRRRGEQQANSEYDCEHKTTSLENTVAAIIKKSVPGR